jgi:hypothetical protein
MRPEIEQLLTIIDQGYDRKSWHGTNLRGSIRGLTAAQAAWRPGPRRHNIHELVVHAAYWKYAVWRRLSGSDRGTFPLTGSNWFGRASPDEKAWRADVALLGKVHRDLRATVAAFPPASLNRPLPKSEITPFTLMAGIAAHDVYHAGQIQLVKVMMKEAGDSRQ